MSIVDSACGPLHGERPDLIGRRPSFDSDEFQTMQSQSTALCNPTAYFRIKPFFELSLTLLCTGLILPLLAAISLLILVLDGRPIFYRQVRVGKNQSRFLIWKFRTMRPDAEKGTGPVWCSTSDSRVTQIGRWLRATHLDELPQVFNVIAGDMHLIGPRPERPELVENLSKDIPGYHRRHLVRPGITGLAQVMQGYDTCISDVARKVTLDVSYIQSATLLHDIHILLLTIPHVIGEVWSVFLRKMRARKFNAPVTTVAAPLDVSNLSLELQIQQEINEQIESVLDAASPKSVVPMPKLNATRDFNRVKQNAT
jgi:lipopolysaccharide/colanic/teichoic acid biosynthesis glycosyltransferase